MTGPDDFRNDDDAEPMGGPATDEQVAEMAARLIGGMGPRAAGYATGLAQKSQAYGDPWRHAFWCGVAARIRIIDDEARRVN